MIVYPQGSYFRGLKSKRPLGLNFGFKKAGHFSKITQNWVVEQVEKSHEPRKNHLYVRDPP